MNAHARTLQQILDGDNAAVRGTVRAWLSVPGNEPAMDLDREEHRARVMTWLRDLAVNGDAAIGFPSRYGGGDDVGASVAQFETLAFGDLSLLVKCGVHFGLFGGAVLHLGTERHHERYLPGVTSLDLPGCFAMTETGHGSNVQALGTTATYDPATDEFVVVTPHEDARKDYIGNAARDGRMAAVFAQLHVGGESRGVHCLLVPIRDDDGRPMPGVRIEDCGAKLGLEGVDNGRLWFDHVRIPRENLLDRYAQVDAEGTYTSAIEDPTRRFFTMLGTLVMGRVSVAGASVSAAKVAHVVAIRRALARRQFGPPGSEEEVVLMDYRTHQRRLLPDLAQTYALHFTQDRLRARLHKVFTEPDAASERDRRELETLAAGVKAVATWHASSTIQACREACGGAGYLRANRFSALKADTDVFTTFEGDNTVLLQLVAKNLLSDYKDQFGELNPLGMAQFVAGQVLDLVAERSAMRELFGRLADDLLPGRDDEGDLCHRETQLALLDWRYEHMLSGVAKRLKGGIDAGRDAFEVFLDCQDHVVAVARAWVDLVVYESFSQAIDGLPAGPEREALDRLCSLHGVSVLERERGWYQEHGRLSSTRSKSLIKAVNTLCAAVRDDAEMLVAAFGVPEATLGDAAVVAEDDEASSGAGLRVAA